MVGRSSPPFALKAELDFPIMGRCKVFCSLCLNFEEHFVIELRVDGMVPVMILALKAVPVSHDPSAPEFWFVMSMALLVGFIAAYPMNWWLVSRHLKHGMMTVRTPHEPASGGATKRKTPMAGEMRPVSNSALAGMAVLSALVFGLGLSIAVAFGG